MGLSKLKKWDRPFQSFSGERFKILLLTVTCSTIIRISKIVVACVAPVRKHISILPKASETLQYGSKIVPCMSAYCLNPIPLRTAKTP